MTAKNAMRRWIDAATKEQLDDLALYAETTVGTIRHIAGGYREGNVSAALATRIEHATLALTKAGLPHVMRGDLCAACAGCDLYRKEQQR